MYRPAKGWAAGFLGMAPLLLIAVVAVACGQEPPVLVTLCVRISQGAVLGIFQYVDGLLPWFYLAAPVVFALCVGIGYMAGAQDVGAPGADDGKGQEGEAPPCRAQAEKKDRLGPKGACRKSPFFSAQKRAKKRGAAASSVE